MTNPWSLTRREMEVCKALSSRQGTDAQIAASFGISEHTVNDHLKVIFSKMGVNNRRMASRSYLAWEHIINPGQATPWGLTQREIEICEAIIAGHAEDKLLLRVINTSLRTISAHMTSIFQKMGVQNRVMAALTYDRWLRSTP
jgi:DNA-binding CsgD family transcriptional regulator